MADAIERGHESVAQNPSEKYDQAFFLDLAAKGKDAWNAWRRDPTNKDVRVTFAGVDFSQAPKDQIDFSGFEFGDYADFSLCKWRGIGLEETVRVAGGFTLLDFHPRRAFFFGAAFGQKASFEHASFGDWALFSYATFGQDACFAGATFGVKAWMDAAFGSFADFTGATFGSGASFYGAAFSLGAKFNEANFKEWVSFAGQSHDQWAKCASSKMGSEAFGEMKPRHEGFWTTWNSSPDLLPFISFANTLVSG
jgi:hypothetical protein